MTESIATSLTELTRPRSRSVVVRTTQLTGDAQREEVDRMFLESLRRAPPIPQPKLTELDTFNLSKTPLPRNPDLSALPPFVPLRQAFDNIKALSSIPPVRRQIRKLRLFDDTATNHLPPVSSRPDNYGIIRLQSIWRGASVRARVKYDQRAHLAAAMIQASFCRWKFQRTGAARVVQKFWRVWLAHAAAEKAGIAYLSFRLREKSQSGVANSGKQGLPNLTPTLHKPDHQHTPVLRTVAPMTFRKLEKPRPEWKGVIDFSRKDVQDSQRSFLFEGKGKRRFT